MSLRVADVRGEVVAGLGAVLDPRDRTVEPLPDRVLVLPGVGKGADLQAETALGGAGRDLDRVVIPVAVPLH